MNLRTIALSLTLPVLAVTAFAFTTRVAQDDAGPKPTKQHEMLSKKVGKWNTTMIMPGAPNAKGTSTNRMVGDFWLIDDLETEVMGAPYHGHGVLGYDPEKEKFVGVWADSMNPSLMTFEGEFDEESKTLTYEVPGKNPMTGKAHIEKHETKFISDDEFEFRMLWPGENDTMQEVMKITYERQK